MLLFFRFLRSRIAQGMLLGIALVIAASIVIGPLRLEYGSFELSSSSLPSIGPLATSESGQAGTDSVIPGEEFAVLQEIYNVLRERSFLKTELDPETLQTQTIKTFLESLDDPYLLYSPPQEFRNQTEQLAGKYEGIGAEVSLRDGPATIIAPFEGSPAQKAGIRPGDVILEVDGRPTDGWGLVELVSAIKGEAGTDVQLLILHVGEEEPVLISVTRGVIPIESVFMAILEEEIAYLRISSFSEPTAKQLEQTLEELLDQGVKGVIVDVRSNVGGFLQTTLDATDQFLSSGVILTEVGGDIGERHWEASEAGLATDLPLAVLMNGYSASGAEVFAGALADHGRAKTFGTTTYGKGSVTTTSSLSNGYGLSYTLARWVTPNGTLIEGQGLEADVVVAQPLEIPLTSAGDIQLLAALEYMRGVLVR